MDDDAYTDSGLECDLKDLPRGSVLGCGHHQWT